MIFCSLIAWTLFFFMINDPRQVKSAYDDSNEKINLSA